MKLKDDLSLIWNRGIPILIGAFKRATWPLICARLSQRIFGTFSPFTTQCGYRISQPQQLMEWWDLAIEEGPFLDWPELMPDNPTIYDIGANYGVFGWLCRKRWPKALIIGFEPVPHWNNHCATLNCYSLVSSYALSNEHGQAKFGIIDEWSSGSLNLGVNHNREIDVCQIPLDAISMYAPDFIKCDVDGSELDVVSGGCEAFKQSKAAMIECYFDPSNANKISKLIGKNYTKRQDYLFI